MRTIVYAETRQMALRWCGQNEVRPYARTTYILGSPAASRGFTITPEDRVVFVGDVASRSDYETMRLALAPALSPGVEIEHVAYR